MKVFGGNVLLRVSEQAVTDFLSIMAPSRRRILLCEIGDR
jgi:hypothetical protein